MKINVQGKTVVLDTVSKRMLVALTALLMGCIIIILGTFATVVRAAKAPNYDEPSAELKRLVDDAVNNGGVLIHCNNGVCTDLATGESTYTGQPSGLYMVFPNDPNEEAKILQFQQEYLKLVKQQ
jgi:hypothetical protein